MTSFPAVATLKTADDFRRHLAAGGIDLPFDEQVRIRPRRRAGTALAAVAGDDRQPLLHPADGRLGRHDRRSAVAN